jgi:LysM repeat protein
MFNNFERMQSMESVIASAIPAKAEQILGGVQKKGGKTESKVVVEDAEAGISPTTAVNKETMSKTVPETKAGEGQASAETVANQGSAGSETQTSAASAETGKAPEQTSAASAETGKAPEQTSAAAAETNKAPSEGNKASAETSQAPAETEAAAASGQRVHVVQEGETLYGIIIAEYHTVNKLKEICELNGLEDENKIVAGQKLLLP